jgi:hypothetical protein
LFLSGNVIDVPFFIFFRFLAPQSSIIYDKRSLGECMVMKWHYETRLTPFFFYFLDSLEVEYTVSIVWVGGCVMVL